MFRAQDRSDEMRRFPQRRCGLRQFAAHVHETVGHPLDHRELMRHTGCEHPMRQQHAVVAQAGSTDRVEVNQRQAFEPGQRWRLAWVVAMRARSAQTVFAVPGHLVGQQSELCAATLCVQRGLVVGSIHAIKKKGDHQFHLPRQLAQRLCARRAEWGDGEVRGARLDTRAQIL